MPYLDMERRIYFTTDRASRKNNANISTDIMQTSNVVIDANFRILKNRFGPHTDTKFIFMARNYMGEFKYNRVDLDDELFRIE